MEIQEDRAKGLCKWWGSRCFSAGVALFLSFCSLVTFASAEPAFRHPGWGRAYGGIWTDDASSIQSTGDGGLIVAGRTYSFPPNGYEDAWILKLRSDGDVEWEKAYGEELWDRIDAIQQTADGGFVAAGNRVAPGGSQDVWVMKLEPDGRIAWQKTFGRDDYYEGALAMQQTSDGGFIVVAWAQSYEVGDQPDAWVLKLRQDGQIEWQRYFGGDLYDILISIQQTSDGGYILGGGTFSYGEDPLYSDAWILKLLPNGNVDWENIYGGPGDEVVYAIQETPGGGYILAGWTTSFHQGWGDGWVLRLAASGNIIWQKSYGGKSEDVLFALVATSDGGAVLAGYTSSFGQGRSDGWLLRLAQNGTSLWQRTFGGEDGDTFRDVQATSSGFVATGSTRSFGAGEEDVWVVDISSAGSLRWSSIDKRSAAAAMISDASEWQIDGVDAASAVSPTLSHAVAMDTACIETDLSNPPPRPVVARPAPPKNPSGSVRWPFSPGLSREQRD